MKRRSFLSGASALLSAILIPNALRAAAAPMSPTGDIKLPAPAKLNHYMIRESGSDKPPLEITINPGNPTLVTRGDQRWRGWQSMTRPDWWIYIGPDGAIRFRPSNKNLDIDWLCFMDPFDWKLANNAVKNDFPLFADGHPQWKNYTFTYANYDKEAIINLVNAANRALTKIKWR